MVEDAAPDRALGPLVADLLHQFPGRQVKDVHHTLAVSDAKVAPVMAEIQSAVVVPHSPLQDKGFDDLKAEDER